MFSDNFLKLVNYFKTAKLPLQVFFSTFSRSFAVSLRFSLPFFLLHVNLRNSFQALEEANPPKSSPFVLLSKKDYFNRIVGNSRDFFFFIVFQEESSELFAEAKQIAGVLRKGIDKYTPGANVIIYLIERGVYRDIKASINRVKNSEIFEKDTRNNAIEVYFKTPYSGNQAYIKYKPGSFYDERKQKKLFQLIRKLINPVEIINNPEALLKKLHLQSLNRINNPLIVKALPESASEKSINKFKKTAFYFFERKILPLGANFVIVNKSSVLNTFDMLNNETYILRNDFLSKYFQTINPLNSAGEPELLRINPDSNLVIESPMKFKFFLEKYSAFKAYFAESEKALMHETKDEKTKERICFLSFASPRVFHLSDAKKKSLVPFFKRIHLNPKKPVISLFLTQEDLENGGRLANFERLFHFYREHFHFLVISSAEIEEVFQQANKHYHRFCIFNFFNQNKNNYTYKNYYKNLMFPYEKHFLEDEGFFFERLEELQGKIELYLRNKAHPDYISKTDELVDDINADAFNRNLEKNQPFVVELYDQSTESEFARQIFNKICEESGEGMKFVRMNSLNDSANLVNFGKFPAYLYWDPKARKIFAYQPNFAKIGFRKAVLEEELRAFIFNKSESAK